MRTKNGFATLIAALVVSTTSGCLFVSVPAPVVPLDPGEQRAVVACQKTINRQVRKLYDTAWQRFERCGDEALNLRLEEEREMDSSNIAHYVARREKVVERCNKAFAQIGATTTRMIDTIVARCEPVEDLILAAPDRGDPLAWKIVNEILGSLGGAPVVGSVEELGVGLCASTLYDAEQAFGTAVPRTGDLLSRYFGLDDDDEFTAYLDGFLDLRCAGTA